MNILLPTVDFPVLRANLKPWEPHGQLRRRESRCRNTAERRHLR